MFSTSTTRRNVLSLVAFLFVAVSTLSIQAAKPAPGGNPGPTPAPAPVSSHISLSPNTKFKRGDTNADGTINIADPSFLMNFIFYAGSPAPSCMDTADTNDDGSVNIADGSYLASAIFFAGAPGIPAPHVNCGNDPSSDNLGCVSYNPCDPSNGAQRLMVATPQSDFASQARAHVADGYQPVWIDGYNVGGKVYFNAIFRSSDQDWKACANMSQSEATDFVNDNFSDGYRIAQLESYERGLGVSYAAILTRPAAPRGQLFYVNQTGADYSSRAANLISRGWRPLNVSLAYVLGQMRYTSVWDTKDVGTFVTRHGITMGAFSQEHINQSFPGNDRTLQYMAVSGRSGTPTFDGTWDEARNFDLTRQKILYGSPGATLLQRLEDYDEDGYTLRMIVGFELDGEHKFAAHWTKSTLIITNLPPIIIGGL